MSLLLTLNILYFFYIASFVDFEQVNVDWEKPLLFVVNVAWDVFNLSRSDCRQKEKINLNIYFHTSLWCLIRFYEGLKGLHKTF